MNLDMIWQTIRVNVRLHLAHPLGYAALILAILWAIAVPTIGISRAKLAAREQELGYPPISDSLIAGQAAAQVSSAFMTLLGIFLLINNLDRERSSNLGAVFASLPVSGPALVMGQYISNIVTLLICILAAYIAALAAYLFRGLAPLSLAEFFWPGILFPLSSAFVLAALPLFLDALNAHQIVRILAYSVIMLIFNLGPFALAAMSYLDHPLHPFFEMWLTANMGLDTLGMWYIQTGYPNLILTNIEQLGTPVISSNLLWIIIIRPRLAVTGLGVLLAAFAAWRFDRFQI